MAWHGVTMEMPRCVQLPGNPSEISVFERQQMRLKSQHQQQQTISRNSQAQSFTVPPIEEDFPKDLQLEGLIHLDGWPDMLQYPLMGSADQLEHPSSNFGSGSTTIDGNSTTVEVCSNGTYVEEMNRNGLRKRKTAERAQTAPLVDGSDLEEMKVSGEKRAKCEVRDGGAVLLHQGKHEVQLGNGKSRKTASKDNLKPSSSSKVTTTTTTSEVVQKSNYIHVRARRGQATDSHSLAERARREKISERMKYLQDLVPGCNKITGKAGMLDEIINYVQSLQRQVEFLSMKLAAANPVFDFGSLELSILKENASACSGGLPVTMAISPDLMSSSPLSSSSMVPTANPINGGLGLALNLQDVQLNHTSDPAIALSNYNVDVHNFHVAGANCSPTWDATPQKVIPVNNFGTMPAVPITKLYHGAT